MKREIMTEPHTPHNHNSKILQSQNSNTLEFQGPTITKTQILELHHVEISKSQNPRILQSQTSQNRNMIPKYNTLKYNNPHDLQIPRIHQQRRVQGRKQQTHN